MTAPFAVALLGCASAPAPHGGVSPAAPAFIEDDYARALAQARDHGSLLFIDAWAPWCHTCMSMRAYVLPDVARSQEAAHFVLLSLDTERETNAAIVEQLAVRVLPTMYVIDPRNEHTLFEWPGSMTTPELRHLLREASSKAAPSDWIEQDMRSDVAVTHIAETGRFGECVRAADEGAAALPMGTALLDVLRTGLDCATHLPEGDPDRDAAGRLIVRSGQAVSQPSTDVLADDRSDLYSYLVAALHAFGQGEHARHYALEWASFLENEALHAPTPGARAVFDSHRLGAYLELGQPERAIPMLEQSARAFPDDYNPRARLATAYAAMKRYDAALSNADAALERAYGPRKLRIFSLKADILMAKGDRAGAEAALREALEYAKTTTLGSGYDTLRDALAKRLAEMR